MKNLVLLIASLLFCAEVSAQEKVELLALDFVTKMMNKASFQKEEGHYNPPTNVVKNYAHGDHNADLGEPVDYYAHRLTKKFFVEVTHYIDDTLSFQIMLFKHKKYDFVQTSVLYAGTNLVGMSVIVDLKSTKKQKASGLQLRQVYWIDLDVPEAWAKTDLLRDNPNGYQDVLEGNKSVCTDPDQLAPLLKLALK